MSWMRQFAADPKRADAAKKAAETRKARKDARLAKGRSRLVEACALLNEHVCKPRIMRDTPEGRLHTWGYAQAGPWEHKTGDGKDAKWNVTFSFDFTFQTKEESLEKSAQAKQVLTDAGFTPSENWYDKHTQRSSITLYEVCDQ
jgi:hypothetical protein